jgi:hypothetical protein
MLIDEIIGSRIEKAFRGKRMVFFVGAGISVPSGVPDFGSLNKEVIQTIANGEIEEDECSILARNIRPEIMYQIAMDELESGENVIHSLEMLEGYDPNYYHYFLAEALRQGNYVFTTNLDNLIEIVCRVRDVNVKDKICYGRNNDEDFKNYLRYIESKDISDGYIFKLHGSIEEEKKGPDRYNTVQFAIRQVGKGLSDPKKEILEYFLKNFDFCFIGYSCRDDFSVFPVFSETKVDKDIFWFDYDDSPLGRLDEGDRLRFEIEKEENKPIEEERDWKTLNVNKVLLGRKKGFKFVGNSGKFIDAFVRDTLKIEVPHPTNKELKKGNTFVQWGRDLRKFERKLFIGRLFEQAHDWRKAELFYMKTIVDAKNDIHFIKVKEKIADLYYKECVKEKENDAVNIYKDCIEKISKDSLRVSNLKVRISNVRRRQGVKYFQEAENWAKQAKEEFELILSEEKRKKRIDYARCLNVLGLAKYSLGRKDENYLESAEDLCKQSLKIKEELGDRDGTGESENAIALILTQKGIHLLNRGEREEAKRNFTDAIYHAEKAFDIRYRIGNYRGCAQNSRNVAYPYSRLMNFTETEEKRQFYFDKARENYVNGISFWYRIRPKPPVGEILSFSNILSGFYIDFCNQTEAEEQKKRWSYEIIFIYKNILVDSKMERELKENESTYNSAKQNIESARNILKEVGSISKATEAEEILYALNNLKS